MTKPEFIMKDEEIKKIIEITLNELDQGLTNVFRLLISKRSLTKEERYAYREIFLFLNRGKERHTLISTIIKKVPKK